MKHNYGYCLLYIAIVCTSFLNTVHSAAFYIRTARNTVPLSSALDTEIANEVFSELRKEPVQIVSDDDGSVLKNIVALEPAAILTTIIEPVQADLVAQDVPAVASEPAFKNAEKPQTIQSGNDAEIEVIPVKIDHLKATEIHLEETSPNKNVATDEKIKTHENLQKDSKVTEKPDSTEDKPKEKESQQHIDSASTSSSSSSLAIKSISPEGDDSERQNQNNAEPAPTTIRPNIIQQAQNTINQLISNNPISNAINNIRPGQSANLNQDPDVPIVVAQTVQPIQTLQADPITTTRPNLFQQLQSSVQSIQNQIQSVFNPNTGIIENQAAVTQRPGILQQIQSVVGQPIQGFVSGIQTNLQNAQNQITGIFRPPSAIANSASPAAATNVDADLNDEPITLIIATATNPSNILFSNIAGQIANGQTPIALSAGNAEALVTEPAAVHADIPIVNQKIETVNTKVESPAGVVPAPVSQSDAPAANAVSIPSTSNAKAPAVAADVPIVAAAATIAAAPSLPIAAVSPLVEKV